RAGGLEAERGGRVREELLRAARDAFGRADLESVRVKDYVLLGFDLDVARRLDLDELVRAIEDDLVLLRLVDDRDFFGALLVVEDDAVARAGLDQLGVVLARVVGLDDLLLLGPQRA